LTMLLQVASVHEVRGLYTLHNRNKAVYRLAVT
jgi:hypothetical protein